jgi:hypothetical protein
MAFPASPSNGQLATVNNITYTYTSANNSWQRLGIKSGSDIQINSLIINGTTNATSTTSGALQVAGGAGIGGNVYIGSTMFGTATSARYADLAENYLADAEYAPGTVVMFGGHKEVTVATAETTAVAGVISTNPAHLMNGELQGDHVAAVALTGRVPCCVVGPVKKGDLLVSAGEGYAKSCTDPKPGQVIGKALEEYLEDSKTVIEVVVGRY